MKCGCGDVSPQTCLKFQIASSTHEVDPPTALLEVHTQVGRGARGLYLDCAVQRCRGEGVRILGVEDDLTSEHAFILFLCICNTAPQVSMCARCEHKNESRPKVCTNMNHDQDGVNWPAKNKTHAYKTLDNC